MHEEFTPPEGVEAIQTEAQSQAWLIERQKGIGGSDLADLLATDYGCRRKLHYSKRGHPKDFDDSGNFRLTRGHRQEPVARALYAEITGRRVTAGLPTFAVTSPEVGFNCVARTNVDGIFMENNPVRFGVLEIKTLGLESFNKYKKHGLPDHYIAQLQWGMGILKLSWGSFAIFSPELDSLRHFDIDFDEEVFNSLLSLAFSFWRDYMLDPEAEAPEKLDPDSKACKYCSYRLSCQNISKSGVHKTKV